ncbi:MAG TPA: hypothetical protein VFF69_04385 [Phycisphaerales bacterium]|nr:hypothetical protein [Phycisphaerales bacterium]
MSPSRMTWRSLIAAGCLGLLPAPAADAQTAPPDAQPQRERPADAETADLRAKLIRILDHLDETAATVRAAIAEADAGGSSEEIIDALGGPGLVRQFSDDWERWRRVRQEHRDPAPGAERPAPEADGPRRIDPARVMEFLEEHAPEVAARIAEVRSGSPRRAEALLARLGPRIAEILAARERDPALAEIMTREFKVGMELLEVGGQAARARREGDDGRLGELRPRLAELAAEQVDLRLRRREHEITVLAERIAALRQELDEQRQERQELIDAVVERASEGWRDGPEEERRREHRRGD